MTNGKVRANIKQPLKTSSRSGKNSSISCKKTND